MTSEETDTWAAKAGRLPREPKVIAGTPAGDQATLDSRLVAITMVSVLLPVMVNLDTTVVNVAQRTFIHDFSSTQAVVAWTVTGYALALAAVIPLTGWAANRLGTKRLVWVRCCCFRGISAVRAGIEYPAAGGISGIAGPRRRNARAATTHHPRPRGRPRRLGRVLTNQHGPRYAGTDLWTYSSAAG